MSSLLAFYRNLTTRLEQADWILPTAARLVFAGVLLLYFWVSGLTKIGSEFSGLFAPGAGAYVQIFPLMMEEVGYDTSQFGFLHKAVVIAGTWSEFILPGLIVIGLFTRIAALGMIGFVVVQSLTDLFGHGGFDDPAVYGAWFDRVADSAIMDQRAMWILLLLILVVKGAGPISFDRALAPKTKAKP